MGGAFWGHATRVGFYWTRIGSKKITKLLDECLLSDADLLLGKDYWAQFPDPFPEWGEAA